MGPKQLPDLGMRGSHAGTGGARMMGADKDAEGVTGSHDGDNSIALLGVPLRTHQAHQYVSISRRPFLNRHS